EESDTADVDEQRSCDSSPLRQRRAGILKGGRLWKSLDNDKDVSEQKDNRQLAKALRDDDVLATQRSVRFVEKPKDCDEEPIEKEKEPPQLSNPDQSCQKDYNTNTGH
ncbi:jg7980, partial [Pararge aegeria aegeria]